MTRCQGRVLLPPDKLLAPGGPLHQLHHTGPRILDRRRPREGGDGRHLGPDTAVHCTALDLHPGGGDEGAEDLASDRPGPWGGRRGRGRGRAGGHWAGGQQPALPVWGSVYPCVDLRHSLCIFV
jgi:hypothetical protein